MKNENEALVIVDVQNGFCPGGNLAVAEADRIVPGINVLAAQFTNVILTQDWHPAGHSSFASSHEGKQPLETVEMPYGVQVLWPDHCVQGTADAGFHPDLQTDRARLVIRKGMNPAVDSYSAFQENDQRTLTGLAGYLRGIGVARAHFVGIAGDYCVGWSAADALEAGFEAVLHENLIASIAAADWQAMKAKLAGQGAVIEGA